MVEVTDLDKRLEAMERRGVELERNLRRCSDGSTVPAALRSVSPTSTPSARHLNNCVVSVSDEEEEEMLMEWFDLNHERHVLVRRDMELGYLWASVTWPVVIVHVRRRAWRLSVVPGWCSTSWRRGRRMWSTSSGGSSLNKVGSLWVFFCFVLFCEWN